MAQPDSTGGLLDSATRAVVVQADSELGRASLIGQRLGVYQVAALLGVGGMGEVYRARDTRLGRDVAIKVLPRALTADPGRLKRFEREARVLASLNHPNIAAIYGVEDFDPPPDHLRIHAKLGKVVALDSSSARDSCSREPSASHQALLQGPEKPVLRTPRRLPVHSEPTGDLSQGEGQLD